MGTHNARSVFGSFTIEKTFTFAKILINLLEGRDDLKNLRINRLAAKVISDENKDVDDNDSKN